MQTQKLFSRKKKKPIDFILKPKPRSPFNPMEEEEGPQGFNLKKKAQDRSEMNMKRENKTAFQKPKPTSTQNIRNQVYPVPNKKVEERFPTSMKQITRTTVAVLTYSKKGFLSGYLLLFLSLESSMAVLSTCHFSPLTHK